ncbi:MAG TPA: HAMP domain-containing sensor histidine kinase [Flavobacterium sp.]|uniref:sensor histidine kinase n=2 Tax=Flavobacterium TaxID=237 RepID=UPI0025BA5CEE|nr:MULTISPECIES: HAMP domain-containing sensor histidine kinase [unclassified Flavobacterium]HRE78723.1 HAMP domain-containing sensor histidine kinase [Flavobacterium sp.]
MLKFSFRNRIAFYYIISTALLITIVFLVIYQMVSLSVYNHINDDIQNEVEKHLQEIEIDHNNTYLIQVDEWREREHNTVDVNPVFVEFFDSNNELIDKSPNLKKLNLKLYPENRKNEFIDTYLNKKPIRQIQVPLYDNQKVIGYLVVAMSLDDAIMVLSNLRNILFISLPIILISLFLIARFIVGRSIKPIKTIIETSKQISRENLSSRIDLPQNKDELFVLSKTINDLLDRIENAVEREKQFTSDASHELRTPLAVIKGTLEVLVRKPRNQSEYEEKINYSIKEVDRLNQLVDELLLLARFENQKQNTKKEPVFLNALILDVLARFSQKINDKNIKIENSFADDYTIDSDNYLVSIIISNLVSNAIKYSNPNGKISIALWKENNQIICKIQDNGIGISSEELNKIGNRFYRSQSVLQTNTKGTGLGLSIVKRLTDLLNIDFQINSKLNVETIVELRFN